MNKLSLFVMIFLFFVFLNHSLKKCGDTVRCAGEDLYLIDTQFPVFDDNSSLLGLLPCEHCQSGVVKFGETAEYEVFILFFFFFL